MNREEIQMKRTWRKKIGAVVALLACGPDNLVIPSMVLIFASLLIGRKKLCA